MSGATISRSNFEATVTNVPTLWREGVRWRSLDPTTVEVTVEVTNDGESWTDPATLVIEAAAFGAFVPGAPVARTAVGALEPGGRRQVVTQLDRRRLDMANMPLRRLSLRPDTSAMAEALIDAKRHPHWIGNLNVYFESARDRAVERHCAFDLRVPAGCMVAAMLIVKARADECSAVFESTNPQWQGEARLQGPLGFMTVNAPSELGSRTRACVVVTRLRDSKAVPVEFEFETVDGWGESVGCVRVE
jgi:hypothetical protein